MIVESALLVALGASIGKFLLHEYVGGFREAAAQGVLDFAKDKIKDALTKRKAELEFEKIGSQIVDRITKDLKSSSNSSHQLDLNKVINRLNECGSSGIRVGTF